MNAKVQRESKHIRQERTWITYIGLLETQLSMDLEIYVGKDSKAHPAGFGHLAGAPAQLLIKTLKNEVIVPMNDDK